MCNDASLIVSYVHKTQLGVLLIFDLEGRHTRSKQVDVCEVGGSSDVQLQSMSLIYLCIYLFHVS